MYFQKPNHFNISKNKTKDLQPSKETQKSEGVNIIFIINGTNKKFKREAKKKKQKTPTQTLFKLKLNKKDG